MIIEKVKDTIINNNLIARNEHIVIGLSGGPDSVCLFHILYRLKDQFGITLHAVHINHKLRRGAAEEDQQYAEEFAKRHGVQCHTFIYDVNRIAKERGTSSEDAGRQVRYESFYQVAESIEKETGKPVRIAVAQNMNDQAETILMRIMRGTGTDGLSGIEYIRKAPKGQFIIRPLLDISREEIEGYCQNNALAPQIDKTNSEPIYTRNKIRLQLLPYMKENFNGNVVLALNRLSQIAKEDKEYLYVQAEELIRQFGTMHGSVNLSHEKYPVFTDEDNASAIKASIPLEVLLNAHKAIRHRALIIIFEKIGLTKDIAAVHLEQASKLLEEGSTSSSVDFSGGYAMKIAYDRVEFYKRLIEKHKPIEYEIHTSHSAKVPELNGELRVKVLDRDQWDHWKSDLQENSNCYCSCSLSYDAIKAGGGRLLLRNRRQGDYIVPLGMKGRKKLQDYFVDEKIEKNQRELVPLLCIGAEVLWVMGRRINENYKISEDTSEILLLEYFHTI